MDIYDLILFSRKTQKELLDTIMTRKQIFLRALEHDEVIGLVFDKGNGKDIIFAIDEY